MFQSYFTTWTWSQSCQLKHRDLHWFLYACLVLHRIMLDRRQESFILSSCEYLPGQIKSYFSR